MIFAETERLYLRALEENELPRLTALIGAWDVVRWLAVVPFPYRAEHAKEFFADMSLCYTKGEPQFYAMSLKSDNLLIGGVGLHLPRNKTYIDGQIEIGYWLAKEFWGKGLMSEAAQRVRDIGFSRPTTKAIGASTDPDNHASQNVLRKLGLRHMGIAPRDYSSLRGGDTIIKWLLTREEWEQGRKT